MGNLVKLSSSTEVLEYCANKPYSPIVSLWLCMQTVCTSASHYVEVTLMFAYFIPKMAERQNLNALFMTMQLLLVLLEPASSYDLTQEC